VTAGEVVERDGRLTLDLEDPEGQRLSLVDDEGRGDASKPWARSPVPTEYQVRGLGPIVMSVPDLRLTDLVLQRALSMRPAREYAHPEREDDRVVVYEMADGGPDKELHVAVQPGLAPARPGAGGVHHVAFRTPDEEEYQGWLGRLSELGIGTSGAVDRYYFKSIYFREPNGILFEIATDGPGFAVDEDIDTLGETVVLPPFLEPHRDRIVANLKPIE
jgi:glyoxalase family protein